MPLDSKRLTRLGYLVEHITEIPRCLRGGNGLQQSGRLALIRRRRSLQQGAR